MADIFAKEGSDAWFLKKPGLLPPGTACPQCGSTRFEKENNILDVWFESGSSHNILGKRPDMPWPADVYIEGHDQYRGWFNSSLLVGVAAKKASPYKRCIIHGFVLDEQGKAMSKSLGNFIDPKEIIAQNGAEILRLWVAMLNYKEDARFGDETMQRLVEAYRKIRNTWRFLLGNLSDFSPDTQSVAQDEMEEFDRWILEKNARLGRKIRKAYEECEFHTVFHAIYNFFTVELSAYYLDVLKDRLYCSSEGSSLRRSAQTALFQLLKDTLVLTAPILPFTTEEAWEVLPDHTGKLNSVHLEQFPAYQTTWMSEATFRDWEELSGIRDRVLKELETARENKLIGNSLEASLLLTLPSNEFQLLQKHEQQLTALFIVSAVELRQNSGEDMRVEVERVSFAKCQRCWNFSPYVGSSTACPEFCERCEKVVTQE